MNSNIAYFTSDYEFCISHVTNIKLSVYLLYTDVSEKGVENIWTYEGEKCGRPCKTA
jgi:hypothetical protein